jgi:hypothetical protein
MNAPTPLEDEMTVGEMLSHLEEIKSRQKTVFQDASVKMAISIIRRLIICQICNGSGTLTVPESDGESASEEPCPNPVHEYANR